MYWTIRVIIWQVRVLSLEWLSHLHRASQRQVYLMGDPLVFPLWIGNVYLDDWGEAMLNGRLIVHCRETIYLGPEWAVVWKRSPLSHNRKWESTAFSEPKNETAKDPHFSNMSFTEKCTTWLTVLLMHVFPFLSLLWQDVVSRRTKLTHREALSLKKYKLALIIAGKRAESMVQTAILFSKLIFLQTAELCHRVSWIGRWGCNFSNLEGQRISELGT